MSHLIVKNPYLPAESFGLDYDSPRARTFGLTATLLRSSPGPFGKPGAGLPRWLNFKTNAHGTPQNQHAEALTSARSAECQKSPQRTLRRDSTLSNSIRSGKSANLGSCLRKKVEEHEMKTKTDEWKKNREYRVVRERRNLTRKQNPKLRRIRRFYVSSIFCIFLGIIFIFGSTVQSLGDGTVFWTFKEKFKIIGLVTTTTGVIMLMVTVGYESRHSEKWQKKGIHEKNPLIHPDFFKEPERLRSNKQISKQTSESSFDPENDQSSYQRVRCMDAHQDDGNYFLCSTASIESKVTGAEKFIFHEIKWSDSQLVDKDAYQCSSNRLATNHVTRTHGEDRRNFKRQRIVFEVADKDEKDAFLYVSV